MNELLALILGSDKGEGVVARIVDDLLRWSIELDPCARKPSPKLSLAGPPMLTRLGVKSTTLPADAAIEGDGSESVVMRLSG